MNQTDLPASNSDETPEQSTPTPSLATPSLATAERLYALANGGHISQTALEEGLNFIGYRPGRREWQWFINTAILVLGAAFLVAGIFFFFAYNWNDLHRFAKLGLIQGAILIAAGLAHYLGMDRLSGKIALTTAALLVGALIALAGQIYQSTADAYTLFLYWAIYIVIWVVIGRFAPLWLLLVGLLNMALQLYWGQSGIGFESRYEGESTFLLNAAALIGWEWFRRGNAPWMQVRWWPRIVVAIAFISITGQTISYIMQAFRDEFANPHWVALVLYLPFIIGVYVYYRYMHRDLLILTMMALSVIGVITAGVARLVDFEDVLMFIVLAVVVIVQAGFAAMWLRNIGTEE